MKAISDRKRKRGAFCKKSISDGIQGHDYGPKEKVALFARRPFLRASRAMVTGQKNKGNFFFYIKPIFEDVGDILWLLQGPYLSSALLSSSSSSYLLSSFAFQVRRVQGEVASVSPQSGLQPQERHSLHSGVGDHRLQPQVPRGRQVPLVHGATLHSVHRRPSTTPFQELHRPPPAAYHRQIQGKVPTGTRLCPVMLSCSPSGHLTLRNSVIVWPVMQSDTAQGAVEAMTSHKLKCWNQIRWCDCDFRDVRTMCL